MQNTNQISIDGSGNITLQNIHGSTITIGKGDDAAAIMAKLEQLQEAQLDALQQIIGQQTERFSDLLKVLLKGVVAQKNIVSGSISNVGGDVHIGDIIAYTINNKFESGDRITGNKIDRQIIFAPHGTYIENNGDALEKGEPIEEESKTMTKSMKSKVSELSETPSGVLSMLLGLLPKPVRPMVAIIILILVGYVGYHYFMPNKEEAQIVETPKVVTASEKVYVSGIIRINNGAPQPNEIERMTLRDIDANSARFDATGKFTFTDVKIPANRRLLVDVIFAGGKLVSTEELIVGEADKDTKTVRLPDLYATRPQPAKRGKSVPNWKIQVNVNTGSGNINSPQN
jgi:hypothetical protein